MLFYLLNTLPDYDFEGPCSRLLFCYTYCIKYNKRHAIVIIVTPLLRSISVSVMLSLWANFFFFTFFTLFSAAARVPKKHGPIAIGHGLVGLRLTWPGFNRLSLQVAYARCYRQLYIKLEIWQKGDRRKQEERPKPYRVSNTKTAILTHRWCLQLLRRSYEQLPTYL